MNRKEEDFLNRFFGWFVSLSIIFGMITLFMKVKFGWNIGTWLQRFGLGVLFSAAGGLFASLSGASSPRMSDSTGPSSAPQPTLAKDDLREVPVYKLSEMLKDGNPKTRRNVVSAIATRCEPAAFSLLRNALKDPDDFVRIFAVKALARSGDTSLIPEIEAARDVSHQDNRMYFDEAIVALRQNREKEK